MSYDNGGGGSSCDSGNSGGGGNNNNNNSFNVRFVGNWVSLLSCIVFPI